MKVGSDIKLADMRLGATSARRQSNK